MLCFKLSFHHTIPLYYQLCSGIYAASRKVPSEGPLKTR